MPEYLAPGVFVEETSFRSKSIEGVSTTTTGFIGPCRYGSINLEPDLITSLGEFERIYGDRSQLKFTKVDDKTSEKTPLDPMHNYMWHAVRAFFEEGGTRLYVSRVFRPIDKDADDGCSSAWLPRKPITDTDSASAIRVRARFPGELGNMQVRLTLRLSQNILSSEPDPEKPNESRTTVKPLLDGDVVMIVKRDAGSPPDSMMETVRDFYLARSVIDPDTRKATWQFEKSLSGQELYSPSRPLNLSDLQPDLDKNRSDLVFVVTAAVAVMASGDSDVQPVFFDGIALHPGHKRAGEADSLFDRFAPKPGSAALARRLPIVITQEKNRAGSSSLGDGIEVLKTFFAAKTGLEQKLLNPPSSDEDRSIRLLLEGGNDGLRPTAAEYEGTDQEDQPFKTGLKAFEDIEDISIVAAPGSTHGYENGYRNDAATIVSHLISHADRMKYRIAVLDSGDDQTIADVRRMRARYDSKYAAFYYPWVRVLDPVTRAEISLPPSGFVAGIYARNDRNRAVYKAPANEVVNLAVAFETMLNKSQQEVLNPEGINCFRFFEGRGNRLWGARTISSDPEWKYVNVRRYFAYLERSVDKGTQWAVFEPNGEALWANVRRTIEDFLFNEWVSGALLGEKPEKAFFVKCDRSTMTQNDLDNGRLICLIGVAALKPAEFVIFRIGQWTADRRS